MKCNAIKLKQYFPNDAPITCWKIITEKHSKSVQPNINKILEKEWNIYEKLRQECTTITKIKTEKATQNKNETKYLNNC